MGTIENRTPEVVYRKDLTISPRKKLVVNSTIYFAGSMLTKTISFLLLPVYTRLFSPTEYGVWGTILSFTAMLAPFFQLGLHDAVARFYYRYYQNEHLLKTYFSTIFNTLAIVTIVLEILLIILSPYFSNFLLGNRIYLFVMVLLIIDIGLSAFVQLFTNLFQYAEKALHFSIIQFTRSALTLSLIILFVVHFKIGILGFAVSMLTVDILFFIICAIFFRKFFALQISTVYLKGSVIYGAPFFLMAILGWFVSYSSILYITKLQNAYDAGLFSMAFNISAILGFICVSVQQVWSPIFMKNLEAKSSNFTNRIIQFQTVYMAFVAIIGMGISLVSKELFVLFLNPRYHEAWIIVPILMYYYLFTAMGQQFYLKICFVQKTNYLFYTNLITAGISILANIFLIKYLSIVGAAISMVIVIFITVLFYFYYSQRFMYIIYEFKKMYTILLVFITGTVMAFILNFSPGYNLIAKGSVFVLLFLILTAKNILPYKEIKNLAKEFNLFRRFVN